MRPGYRPPEDVETYKNRSAEAWKNRGQTGVPGADSSQHTNTDESAAKSKNAKRREAARKKVAERTSETGVASALQNTSLTDTEKQKQDWRDTSKVSTPATAETSKENEEDIEIQKKIRNQLKKLKAVSELKAKKVSGEKLSPDQLIKIGKESELINDLKKLGYDGPELPSKDPSNSSASG